MNLECKTSGDYTPEKLEQIEIHTRKLEEIQYALDDLNEEIFSDIVDGWTTGDKFLDFILVACNGIYDPLVICMQYRRLSDMGLRKPGQQIMLIQKTKKYLNEELVVLRNIYLANLRAEMLDFDINNQTLHVPVETKYFVWREFIKDDLIVGAYAVRDSEWITTGPIHNKYCEWGAMRIINNTLCAPENSVCSIELLPTNDRLSLYDDYRISSDDLDYYYKTWIKAKSSS